MPRIVGTDSPETLNGTASHDSISALDGDDIVYAGAGDDVVFGGIGEDTLYGDDGADFVLGEDGDDVILGGTGDDVLDGGYGYDDLSGEAGNDRLYGRNDDDRLDGGDGDDLLIGGDGNDSHIGGAGADRIRAGAGDDTASGGDGNDILLGQDGADTLDGDAGNDFIQGGAGNDTLSGGDGDDRISGGGGDDLIDGGDGIDICAGNGGDDTFTGGAGNDRFDGGGGVGDRSVYSGNFSDYQLLYYPSSGGVRVTDLRAGSPDGSDLLTRVEALQFADGLAQVHGGAFDFYPDGSSEVPADQSTGISISLGGTYSGELETVGDRDWIAVDLVAGQRYAISLDGTGGSPLSDPLVRLYDASGSFVAENDDSGPGLNSLLHYTVQTTGTYYIEAAAWDDTVAGTYTVGLETAAPLQEYTNDQIAEYLRSGYWTGNGQSARHWNVSDGGSITVNLVNLTADGRALARAALELWSDLTGITFGEVSAGGQMVFDDAEEGAFATTNNSGGLILSAEVNVSTAWIDTYGTGLNSYSFQTYIHEIGHALGLGHAGPYNGSADYSADAGYLNDSWQATVMSYFSQTENSYVDASYAFVVSPQVADVLAIQNIYGLARDIRGGNTVYGFNSTAGNAIYDATSFQTVTTYTIVDTGGTDTMDYSGSHADQTLDLRAESHSSLQGGRGNVGIARGTVIENGIGGFGNDTLIGNSANNTLTGNAGNDRFYASGGSDVYDGSAGSDTVIFSGLQSDYAITTNGSGHTVVTDLRAGSPDGVTELISIETIEYGAAPPALAAALDPKDSAGSTVQNVPDPAPWAGLPARQAGQLTDLAPREDGAAWHHDAWLTLAGARSVFDPVMRPLVPDQPASGHDVMPALSPDARLQVQLIDGQLVSAGTLLSEATHAELVTGDMPAFDVGAETGKVMALILPETGWNPAGWLALGTGEEAPQAPVNPDAFDHAIAEGGMALFDAPDAHVQPVEHVEGWV